MTKHTNINGLEFSEPWITMFSKEPNSSISIDLTQFVDPYDYHDFPNSIQIYLNKNTIERIIEKLKETIEKMKEIESSTK